MVEADATEGALVGGMRLPGSGVAAHQRRQRLWLLQQQHGVRSDVYRPKKGLRRTVHLKHPHPDTGDAIQVRVSRVGGAGTLGGS